MLTTTNTQQLKVTLPIQIGARFHQKAQNFGLSTSAYLKFLIYKEVEDLPVYSMSKESEENLQYALKNPQESISLEQLKSNLGIV